MRALVLGLTAFACRYGFDEIRSNTSGVDSMIGSAFDEDGDGIENAIDRCPLVADPADPDGDGDGVGDGCDPRPTTPGDRWVAFEAFDAPAPTGWLVPAGWTIDNGRLFSPADVTTTESVTFDAIVGDVVVSTRLTVTDVHPNPTGLLYRSVGTHSALDAGHYRCLIRDLPSAGSANGGLSRDTTPIGSEGIAGESLGTTATLTFHDVGPALRCVGATSDARTWDVTNSDTTYGPGRAGVLVQNAVAVFDYVAIVESAP